MKITLTKSEFINRFMAQWPEQFSRSALGELFDWIDDAEKQGGEEVEFDPISICCDWTEYETAVRSEEHTS